MCSRLIDLSSPVREGRREESLSERPLGEEWYEHAHRSTPGEVRGASLTAECAATDDGTQARETHVGARLFMNISRLPLDVKERPRRAPRPASRQHAPTWMSAGPFTRPSVSASFVRNHSLPLLSGLLASLRSAKPNLPAVIASITAVGFISRS